MRGRLNDTHPHEAAGRIQRDTLSEESLANSHALCEGWSFRKEWRETWSVSSNSSGKESACHAGAGKTQVRSLGREDALEEGMATHPSILAWRTPWTEEPGGIGSVGSKNQT